MAQKLKTYEELQDLERLETLKFDDNEKEFILGVSLAEVKELLKPLQERILALETRK